jgi:hypothetical protein
MQNALYKLTDSFLPVTSASTWTRRSHYMEAACHSETSEETFTTQRKTSKMTVIWATAMKPKTSTHKWWIFSCDIWGYQVLLLLRIKVFWDVTVCHWILLLVTLRKHTALLFQGWEVQEERTQKEIQEEYVDVCVTFLINCVLGLVVSTEEGSSLLPKHSVLCQLFLWRWKKFL